MKFARPRSNNQTVKLGSFGGAGQRALLRLGFLFLAVCAGVVYVSREFTYGRWDIDPYIYQYIGLAAAGGVVLILLYGWLTRYTSSRFALISIFIFGLIARLMMFASNPVLEDDWHRYLWDGAVVADGSDPYKFSPAEATPIDRFGNQIDWSDDPELLRLQELVDGLTQEEFDVYWRVNYPYYKTIYPPIAHGGFCLAHFISPYNLNGWRGVLLLVDLISFALIVWILGLFGRSSAWVGLYWWNPVVVFEVFNAGHMDVLIVPFLVGALGLAKLGHLYRAVLALSGAAAVKFWPILLAPMLVRKEMFNLNRLIPLALLFCGVSFVLLWPQLRYVLVDPDQGLVAYSEAWRRHAFLYSVFVEGPFRWFGDPITTTRQFVVLAVGGGALWFAWRNPSWIGKTEADRMAAGLLAVTALLLFLSPTGYPWYQVWLAGLIPFAPRLGYLVFTIMAPIYYLRFIFGDENPVYQWIWVPIAFGIPLLLLLIPERVYRRLPHGRP